jgi:enediyne biosynthesis protein E4
MLVINDGSGNYIAKEMNNICQTGPVKAMHTGDFNNDQKMDFIYGGNHFPTEVETARYDGLYPGICYGDGKGNFDCLPFIIDGQFHIDDIRDIKMIKMADGKQVVLISNNNGPMRTYVIQ